MAIAKPWAREIVMPVGLTITTTPQVASAIPIQTGSRGRLIVPLNHPIKAIKAGTIATITATVPEGMNCSA